MDSSFSSFRARRLGDSVQFVQLSSRTVPALIVTLTLAGTRYYNILDSTRGVDVTPSSLIELKLQLKNNVLLATGRS